MFFQLLFLLLSLMLSLLFFIYGFNHYYLLAAARRYRSPAPPEDPDYRPTVCVQLPIYDERDVVRQLTAACARMAQTYGTDRARILLLDDSNDETAAEVDAAIRDFRAQGVRIDLLRRNNRSGYKAGALQAALEATDEEFIVVFDADFLPPPDFLLRTIPFFRRDERLGIIQTRWTHRNMDASLITRAISHAIDVHFLVEQPGRFASGVFLNFNGSGGVLRRQAVIAAGGWQSDTLAEDLDLSYRMQAIGYRILFLRDVPAPGEIPPTIPNFKQQQGRWALGSIRAARKILPGILRDRSLDLRRRVEALLHMTGYMIQPFMVLTFLLTCAAAILGIKFFRISPTIILAPPVGGAYPLETIGLILLQALAWLALDLSIVLCTLAPWMSLLYALKLQRLPLIPNLPSLFFLLFISFGISLSIFRGVLRAFFTKRSWEWTRTPKASDPRSASGGSAGSYGLPLDPLWMWEFGFGLLGIWATGMAIRHSNFNVLFILLPFTLSYALVGGFSILQSRRAKG
jgi:cellulose synthase/poly-beta-1,6-N-acetylglucosamine synthase-like glycosyltransferase